MSTVVHYTVNTIKHFYTIALTLNSLLSYFTAIY